MTLNKTSNLIIFYLVLSLPFFFLIGSFFVNLIAIFVSLYALGWIILNQKYTLLFQDSYFYFFPLFILFIVSSYFSEYRNNSYLNSFSYLSNIMLFLSLPLIVLINEKKKILLSKIVFIIVFLICIDLWVQKFFGINLTGFSSQQAGRLTSFFKDEQIPGSIIFKFSPFVIYYVFTQNRNYIISNYKYIILIFVYFSILITGERASSILSTLLILFLVILNFKKINKKKLLIYFSYMILIFFILFNSKDSIIKERINYTFKQAQNNVYLEYYNNSYNIFSENILIGTGPQTYRYVCPKINDNCSSHPHNYIFELLSDTGFFSPILLIFSFALFLLKKITLVKNNLSKSLMISYTILFFFPLIPTGSFFSSFHMTLTWFSLGFIYSLKKSY